MNLLAMNFHRLIRTLVRAYVSVFVLASLSAGLSGPHLTPNQWGCIRRILSNPATSVDMRQRTQRVVYTKYEDWATNRAATFRKSRGGLCRHIHKEELAIYAVQGLIRAIERCDYTRLGSTPFSVYATKWVDGALLDGMTELHPMTILPKSWRKRRGVDNRGDYLVKSVGLQFYNPNPLSTPDANILLDLGENDHTKVDAFTKRALTFKYETGKKPRTNAETARWMGCSEEYVRRKLSTR
jgi:hypothetical protein